MDEYSLVACLNVTPPYCMSPVSMSVSLEGVSPSMVGTASCSSCLAQCLLLGPVPPMMPGTEHVSVMVMNETKLCLL